MTRWTWQQLVAPNPNIPCTPGLCLVYGRSVFGVKATGKYPTALSNWNASSHRHQDQNFPAGMVVPVWFNVRGNPAGHVAVRFPDGSIYSSSSPISHTPMHHNSLAEMVSYWGGTLTYIGWTEDIEDVNVIMEVPMGVKLLSLASCSPYEKRSDFFALGDDGNLWHKYYNEADTPGWHDWEAFNGGGAVGSLTAISTTPGRIDVCGLNNTGAVIHWFYVDGAKPDWNGPENLGSPN